MATRQIHFRLPFDDWPRARFDTDYGFTGGTLVLEDRPFMTLDDRAALTRGATGSFRGGKLELRLAENGDLRLDVDGRSAVNEDRLRLPPSASAWLHASVALGASFFGFAASSLYLSRARLLADPWSLKMAIHMAGWHLLLTFTLFPASVWGQRTGIRAVQLISAVFAAIHAGIAAANFGTADAGDGPWIALLNALSGVLFVFAVGYGQRAHRDMSPSALFARVTALDRPLPDGVPEVGSTHPVGLAQLLNRFETRPSERHHVDAHLRAADHESRG